MDKEEIISYGKKLGILILSTMGLLIITFLIILIYGNVYMPYKGNCLYKEGITNPNKAVLIAKELHDNWEYKVNSEKIEEILNNSASKGNIQSMLLLGQYHSEGFHDLWENKEHNKDKAAYWFLQAANKGNAEAQGEIGICYKYGKGVNQDFSKALYWLKEGAKNGNAKAQYQLGNIYQYGLALYDSYGAYFKGPRCDDYDYTHLVYEGNLIFIERGGKAHIAKEKFLEEILFEPYNIYIKPDNNKAQYYWKLAANQGLQEAKEALEKIY